MTLALADGSRGHRCAHSSWAAWVVSTDGHGSAGCATRSTHSSKSSPSRFAILIFAGAHRDLHAAVLAADRERRRRVGAPLHDALFTAVSVICVTGLATVDMATYWSPFGNALVFIGVNIGGVGVLTLASILGLVISRRLGLRAKLIAASDTNPSRIHVGPVAERQAVRLGEVGGLLATVAISALVIELAIAIAMFPSMLAAGYDPFRSVWYSFYYSAMAFTNTGFSPNPGGMAPFIDDYWFQSLLMIGVFLGSLGFPVIFALAATWRTPRRWSVHVKLTLTTTVDPVRARRGDVPAARVQQPADATGSSTPARRSSSRSSCR